LFRFYKKSAVLRRGGGGIPAHITGLGGFSPFFNCFFFGGFAFGFGFSGGGFGMGSPNFFLIYYLTTKIIK
jgi:hypothetical protein